MLVQSKIIFNPFQNEDPKYLSQEEINLYCIIKLAT